MAIFEDIILNMLTSDSIEVINWLRGKNLLKSNVECNGCSTLMNLAKSSKMKDGYLWKCRQKNCRKFRSTKTARVGSFFEKSRLPLGKWIHLMYMWSEKMSVTQAKRQANISKPTTVDVFNFFREVCKKHFQQNPVRLGGSQVVVEIDESCFSHKPKHHQGRAPQKPVWVFGLTDTSVKPSVSYFEVVERRNAETLLPIILKVVETGSIIHSDEWRAYRNIQNIGFTHRTVNHSVNFVDPTTGVHTQTIESTWNRHKSLIKTMRGCHRAFLPSYLNQFMWFERFSNNAFESLCQQIANQFPV